MGNSLNTDPNRAPPCAAWIAKFPGLEKHGEGFKFSEEWYSLKDFRDDLHVILVQETATMKGIEYQRPPYPATWARNHGKGRVFYTSMGHREDVWTNPLFQEILTGGMLWALGDLQADISPNLQTADPGRAAKSTLSFSQSSARGRALSRHGEMTASRLSPAYPFYTHHHSSPAIHAP